MNPHDLLHKVVTGIQTSNLQKNTLTSLTLTFSDGTVLELSVLDESLEPYSDSVKMLCEVKK